MALHLSDSIARRVSRQAVLSFPRLAPATRLTVTTSTRVFRQRHKSTIPSRTMKPPFQADRPVSFTQPPIPGWKPGDGASPSPSPSPSTAGQPAKQHISIDPNDPTRPASKNYQFLISSVVPRPIALISTKSRDGKLNLAPFSYFQVIDHDPPLFIVSFVATSSRSNKSQKDTLRNLTEDRPEGSTGGGECVINIVSEHMIQAANATTVDAEYGDSEFDISGLTPDSNTETVSVPRVRESIVSIEGKLVETKEFASRADPTRPRKTTMVIIEGTRFWVREDAIDPDEKSTVNLEVLRPVGRLGSNGYGRVTEVVEIARDVMKP